MKSEFVLREFLASVRNGEPEDEEIIATLRSISQKERVAYYRAMQRHDVILPSNMPVVLRDVDMTDILLSGTLPPSVLGFAEEASEKSGEVDLEKIGLELLSQGGGDISALLNAIAKAALVDPAVSDEGDDTHLSVSDITSEDKSFIMEWVNRGAPAVKSFRPEERGSVETA